MLRMNALPIVGLPDTCLELTFNAPKEWADLHAAEQKARDKLVCTKGSSIFGMVMIITKDRLWTRFTQASPLLN